MSNGWGYRDHAECVACNKHLEDPQTFCRELRQAVDDAIATDARKGIRKVIKQSGGGMDWFTKFLREEAGAGVRADDPATVQKQLADDVADGRVTLTKPAIERFAKARAYEIWLKRGAVKGAQAGILDEVLESPLSGIGTPSPDDPSLMEIHRAAPASDAHAAALVEKSAEAQVALEAFDGYVDEVKRANPGMSRPACVSKALADSRGTQLYRVYQQANAKLDRVRKGAV